MAPYESGETPVGPTQDPGEPTPRRSRRAARYAVPAAVMGIAALTIGLVPALADSGDPDLPKISAEDLLAKVAASHTDQYSGTVKINTDLGLPDFGGLAKGFAPGGMGDASPGSSSGDGGSKADPGAKLTELASGTHTLRVAQDGDQKQKLSILEDAAEYSLIHNGDDVWAYDSASNQAVHTTGADKAAQRHGDKAREDAPTPQQFAEEALKAAGPTTDVSVDGTARVAGRDAYKLVVKPKQSGTTVGAISIAVDAKNYSPLKFTLTPSSGGAAVIDVGFTKVDFSKPSGSTFDFTAPKGTKVTEGDQLKGGKQDHGKGLGALDPEDLAGSGAKTTGKGWNTIAEFEVPGGQGLPSARSGDVPPDAQKFLDSLGEKASGKFGSGTVFSTRLVNALITDDGKVYVGAVTKDALVKAADANAG
ncbi:outer membrane lipoprotein carrier protein LolA [Streptomyces sp. NPDC050560]|uniref:outer membrane lipoprotein carrier protein LolA n=1 Tax=Streptomyces sp. NPDC050560 TaxID=3365630 RepID=UPI0037A791C2